MVRPRRPRARAPATLTPVAANVTIQLQGALSTKPAAPCGVGSGGTTGPVFVLGLATANRSATQLTSATSQTIDSPASFEVLPLGGNGNFLQEFPPDDRVVTVAIQGQGRIEWLASGAIV